MGVALLLVGCGKMGGAMLDGWLAAGTVSRVVVVEPAGLPAALAGKPGVSAAAGPQDLPDGFAPDVVVLAVKPQVMESVLPGYAPLAAGGAVFLSIAAGKTIGFFERHLGVGTAIVRAMPNTPAAIGRGFSVAVPNPKVTEEQRALCGALLAAAGEVAWTDDEAAMDAVTAVSGSGPAYVFHLVEALAAAGVEAGLPADLAMRMARATVSGAGELLHRTDTPAADLRKAVTSPNGTTQAALEVLMGDGGLTPLMGRAVAAAAARSRELAS
ncbi:pyrroline-5-carboxylate reductase [Azospirillum sp. RWY-5-1]|uniref:Pyrroline-5-carboxylate reductase n=1 Tax=Azospirillum oleiclasticum TaxID=2735135 RepID=A0ABX2TEQ3_9PROT|nr:pyrroline-5-carboxylate reductase [Azospirillum oleiclasticum]NYZ14134.1 pyrroline-5-carboxylate reductase [Azospirillum oleiclasticum]NYZ21618.1 pyrroline-5-carboxylate reductase [Azospirillum oleiclasticum]